MKKFSHHLNPWNHLLMFNVLTAIFILSSISLISCVDSSSDFPIQIQADKELVAMGKTIQVEALFAVQWESWFVPWSERDARADGILHTTQMFLEVLADMQDEGLIIILDTGVSPESFSVMVDGDPILSKMHYDVVSEELMPLIVQKTFVVKNLTISTFYEILDIISHLSGHSFPLLL